jgi:hypothetical protein
MPTMNVGLDPWPTVRRLDEQILVVEHLTRLPERSVLLVLERDVDRPVGVTVGDDP